MLRRTLKCLGFALCLASGAAAAQEGYHTSAVVPIVVDSTSFTQSFVFDSFNGATVKVKFYPGVGTAQAGVGPVTCEDVEIWDWDATRISSLRELCPALVPGSTFGFLVLRAAPSTDDTFKDLPVFAVTSRVSNPAGAGFVVDAVAAATFAAGQTHVSGIRRSAATENRPAYQTNCFLANLDEAHVVGGTPKRVDLRITEPTDAMLSFNPPQVYTGTVYVAPGQLLRLLDVFASTNAPVETSAWDWSIEFLPRGSAGGRPGIATFCTVQDNTSYQADLRLGKIIWGIYGHGAEELQMSRNQYWNEDVLGRPFAIPPGAYSNTHLVYFRRPDTVKCELTSATYPGPTIDQPPVRLTPADGLEIRMLDASGAVVGGGSGMTSTGQLYLGDKSNALASLDGRYLVEVESNGQNTAATRSYSLYCTSGSGNTGGLDLTRYQEAVDRF
jgi:hypothetical protein